jgi:hypothetical protein
MALEPRGNGTFRAEQEMRFLNCPEIDPFQRFVLALAT